MKTLTRKLFMATEKKVPRSSFPPSDTPPQKDLPEPKW